VAGWPGSGKSTLAAALAAELGLPLLARDEIKEALMGGLGRPGLGRGR
jgi:adenylate kinase family enzyme